MRALIFLGCLSIVTVSGRRGFGETTDQEWGFVNVRPNANIFWWLHYTSAKVNNVTDKPLILWLQGGPGSSSTGYGSFVELGPLDTNLQPRNSSWDKYANLLLVDSPVGTGFSYVDDESAYTTNNTQIARDFLVFLKAFFDENAIFQKVPFYIFTESYGGKMVAEIVSLLVKEGPSMNIRCNLTGIALGDSWISPVDSVLQYAPYLLGLGIVDKRGYDKMNKVAQELKIAVDNERFDEAFGLWRGVEYEIKTATYGVDMYNVLNKKQGVGSSSDGADYSVDYPGQTGVDPEADAIVSKIMNGPVRDALNISQFFGTQSDDVFNVLKGDFMSPVVNIVEELLNTTSIYIAVYTGQLDLIVPTPGTLNWVNNMNWKNKEQWQAAERMLYKNEGFVKRSTNFGVYWVERSGHMVPADNPNAMDYILRDVTNNFQV
ncbi:unnamed protein product [Phaedon cochleariae]|uniref:Carboxypeptidase n=1 Tax=Phaedon cochleariae TaxID=80249 RepID=A0A9P0DKR8_PHACE|nr:unnamed protein product [Phaedon cochleariae]